MADDQSALPETPPARPPETDVPAPPPLTDIRIRGPQPKGLNKAAILIAAGGGLAITLMVGATAFAPPKTRSAADSKPLMSAPARPEMAQGAVRNLPATYEHAAARAPALPPDPPAVLGPPLPGDVASFAPAKTTQRQHEDWRAEPARSGAPEDEAPDPEVEEARLAERSQLFFALRQEPASRSPGAEQTPPPTDRPFAALSRGQPDDVLDDAGGPSLFPGAIISASLLTGIDSESPGPVIAQVTQTVHDSATGRVGLIPQGARLIGGYTSATRHGQARIAIMWSRLIMPDGTEVKLDEAGADPSGAAGVSGAIDNHWADVFGAAALGTLINIGVAATEDPQITYGGVGLPGDPVSRAVNEGVQRSAGIVTNRVVGRSLAIPPTLRVESGKRVSIIVTRRLVLDVR